MLLLMLSSTGWRCSIIIRTASGKNRLIPPVAMSVFVSSLICLCILVAIIRLHSAVRVVLDHLCFRRLLLELAHIKRRRRRRSKTGRHLLEHSALLLILAPVSFTQSFCVEGLVLCIGIIIITIIIIFLLPIAALVDGLERLEPFPLRGILERVSVLVSVLVLFLVLVFSWIKRIVPLIRRSGNRQWRFCVSARALLQVQSIKRRRGRRRRRQERSHRLRASDQLLLLLFSPLFPTQTRPWRSPSRPSRPSRSSRPSRLSRRPSSRQVQLSPLLRHAITPRVCILRKRGKDLDLLVLQHGNAVFRLARVPVVHEVVQRARDMLREAGLDGEFGVVFADEEGKGGGRNESIP
jgi:hypothetical protein